MDKFFQILKKGLGRGRCGNPIRLLHQPGNADGQNQADQAGYPEDMTPPQCRAGQADGQQPDSRPEKLDESRAVLDEIFSYLDRPAFQWTQVWEDGDMVMWDNRCTMHRRDGWPADQIRIMHRTTTEGERPHFAL